MLFQLLSPAVAGKEPLRIGVYNNPPKAYVDESGQAAGFWPELTRIIAAREDRELEWVVCPWNECLADLEAGRIDVMVDVAVTDSRRARVAFGNETVLVSWSRVYAVPGNGIETIPDLQGKRIGVMRESVNLDGPEGIRTLLESFAVEAEFVPYTNYAAVAEALEEGRIDAGVTNRDFGNDIKTRTGIAPTPILLQPADLRYAFSKASPLSDELVRRFDARVRELKADPGSRYYDLQEQWLGRQDRSKPAVLPVWLQWTVALLLAGIVILSIGYVLVEIRVRTRTRELQESKTVLEDKERRLAESQRIARMGSWRLDVKANRLEWSEETYRILGVSPGTFTPTVETFLELVHPEDRDRLLAERAPALQGRHPHDISFRIMRPGGGVRHVHERAEAKFSPEGEVACFEGTIQDITEQREIDDRLRYFHQLVEGSEDLFGVCDREYRFLWVNRAYARHYGIDRDQIRGRYLWEVIGETYFREQVERRLERCLEGEAQRFESVRNDGPGGGRLLLTRYYPVEGPDGRIQYAGAVITDITELKEKETELEEQLRLVDMAGRVARLGGWSVDLRDERVTWSNVVAEIHGTPRGYSPLLDEGIHFYADEWRDRIRTLFNACAQQGVAYDEELQIINARGDRVWVRVVGEPVCDNEGNIVRVQGAMQDISARKESEQEAERLALGLRRTLESITDAFFTVDRDWRFRYVNHEAERVLERSAGELLGRNVWEEFPEALGLSFEREYKRAVAENITVAFEEFYPPLGKWFDIRAYPSEEGLAVYFLDVTERKRMIEQLREQEEVLRHSRDYLSDLLESRKALIDSLPAHIALLDRDGNILDVNDQWRHFARDNAYTGGDFGLGCNYLSVCESARGDCSEEAAEVARGLRDVLAGRSDVFAREYPCHSPQQQRWFRVMANRLVPGEDDREPLGAVVMHVDITERKLAEQELSRLAYREPLTGLLTRNGFVRELTDRIEEQGWQPAALVVVLDVIGMRDINDAHGFDTGDRVLIEIGRRLHEQVEARGHVGRTGGDEFILFLPLLPGQKPEAIMHGLLTGLSRPLAIEATEIEIGIRLGYTRLAEEPRLVESLLREAELALFQNREETARSWVAYSSELGQLAQERIELTRELRRALQEQQFELLYQPKVDLQDGRLLGCEALLRWNHPQRGRVAPGLFIPIAEQSKLIESIGDWVLRDVCRQSREWRGFGIDPVRISINVSLVQFTPGDFPQRVRAILDDFEVTPDVLSLEVTESVFERESDSLLKQLRTLHDMGVRLSLDDFGTGYSSLLYLQKYPFDEIKIDQGFVRHILNDAYSREIVNTVMGLARAFGADVMAEGIESTSIRDALLALGCRFGQGYYFSKPLPAEDFRSLLEEQACLPRAGHAE